MAHIDHNGEHDMIRDGYYNVTWGVGQGRTARNLRDDVMLVQYLLKGIAENASQALFAPDWSPPGSVGSFLVDGQMGQVTAGWIRSYQKAVVKNAPGLVLVDNVVDRARRDFSSISKTMYTIVGMNIDFRSAQSAKFRALEDIPDVPPELRAALRKTRPLFIVSGPIDPPLY